MFGKFMNNYYYGKSGKGDYTPEDLPKNRWQLFLEMLRTRLSALCRLNLIYVLPWLPLMIVLFMSFMSMLTIGTPAEVLEAATEGAAATTEAAVVVTGEVAFTEEQLAQQASQLESIIWMTLILMIPCIAITGPWTTGIAYVTRNWARDEHAFIWSDFKDAMKENWKQGLIVSSITSVVPLLAYMCWQFYGQMQAQSMLMVVPQMLTLMVALMWSLAVTYAYPMIVTYKMNLRTVLRNSLLLAVGRLPMSVGIRLLHCVPLALGVVLTFLIGSLIVPLVVFAYYLLIGFGLSRFITASYTNAQFDKFINSRIEGAKVNQGLSEEEEDDWEDDEEEEERELKPWENGYTSQDK
ncbi:MAG: YesL family protein [Clostridia bacterium]|nr:YesL family protein [Clostridia bacterium]